MSNETEQELWNSSVQSESEHARYRLSNMLAHKYEIVNSQKCTLIKRGDTEYFITAEGKTYKATRMIG